ncbi:MAG TPA: NAD(P)-dependent oxidoreductase [Candidatus Eremiobacteraeota bacterium]|nr:MAG: dTDP-4-dehydro-6-deoxyglucose reductase [bacterium ADurb.Bin363]HPZ06758.1 NAD(P)-dependent oxidoreductase [Candidatus Eremiobacteraeota bacterium]
MKVLITGSSGFIGRNLKENLCNKYIIYGPSSSELDLLKEEQVKEYLKKHNFDIIIHSATWNATRNSGKDIKQVMSNNLRMFFNIGRCNKYYGKMIYFGSGAEYDKRYYKPKMPEEFFDTYVPVDEYGFSKYIMSKYTEHIHNIYNLRLFGVFGKYEDWEIRFISNAICKVIYDLPITMRQNRIFDYLYIDDLIPVIDYFIQNKPLYKFYNITPDTSIDFYTITEKVKAIAKKNLPVIVARPGFAIEYSGDNARFRKELPYIKFTSMDYAITQLYTWYQNNLNLIDKDLLLFDK